MGSQQFDHRDYQGYPPQDRNAGRGLAVAGLIAGIAALLLFWFPAVNLVAVVLAIIGLGLGIGALVAAGRARSSAKGLSVAAVIISAAALVVSIFAAVMWASLFTPMERNTVTPSPGPTSTVTRTAAPSSSAGTRSPGSPPSSSAPTGTSGTSAPATPTSGATASR
ncbi:hypothetical protein GCM10009688_23090 [Arthrobacter gandavensis]|uniref:DUF4190 domain-containing protein n=1 Tax=Arthrobacter gandavensis TaxID=169960 RepID=A0ABP5ASD0_9MICC|nr:hypothetical protein [Arthrobacter citreus]